MNSSPVNDYNTKMDKEEPLKCAFCFTETNIECRCGCEWQVLCTNCSNRQKEICNPCIRCDTLMSPVTGEDEIMYFGMILLSKITARICYLDDSHNGNNLISFRKADFDQIRAILLCTHEDDIYDAFRMYCPTDEIINIDYIMNLLYHQELNNGFTEGLVRHFRNRIPYKKRQRNSHDVSLNCWVFKNKIRCVVSILPPRNVVYMCLSISPNGYIKCNLDLCRKIY